MSVVAVKPSATTKAEREIQRLISNPFHVKLR